MATASSGEAIAAAGVGALQDTEVEGDGQAGKNIVIIRIFICHPQLICTI